MYNTCASKHYHISYVCLCNAQDLYQISYLIFEMFFFFLIGTEIEGISQLEIIIVSDSGLNPIILNPGFHI